jgi:3-hydroxyacyl-[acyl-carrier-protein] dehydratase
MSDSTDNNPSRDNSPKHGVHAGDGARAADAASAGVAGAGAAGDDAGTGAGAAVIAPPAGQTPENDEAALRESLKRCTPATVEAALAFRATRDPAFVPAVVIGIVERFVEPDSRPKLKGDADEVRLIEDLGIDSLTMMEIVMLVEEVLQMQINNDELRNLRSVGDVKVFIDCKLRGVPPPAPARFLPVEQIAAVMPMQPPFLFLNEASVGGSGAEGKYRITGDEFFLQGHFKDNPVMPASMMLEALGQLAVLALIEGIIPAEDGRAVDPAAIYFTSCEGVRCHRVCRPGDLLSLSVKPKRAKMPLATFEGHIRVGQEKAIVAEEITLTFGYAGAPAAAGAAAGAADAGLRGMGDSPVGPSGTGDPPVDAATAATTTTAAATTGAPATTATTVSP